MTCDVSLVRYPASHVQAALLRGMPLPFGNETFSEIIVTLEIVVVNCSRLIALLQRIPEDIRKVEK